MRPGATCSLPGEKDASGTWQDCLRSGRECLAAGRPEDALPALWAASRLCPNHPPVLKVLAAACLRAGRPADALALFDQCLFLAPDDGRALQGRGLALHALGDHPAALATFRTIVARHPGAWDAWGSIGDITPDEDERIDAIQCTADTLLLQCRLADAPAGRFANCASALLDARRGHQAAAFITRHATRFAAPATVHAWLAVACYEIGAFREALHHKQAALNSGGPEHAARRPLPVFSPGAAARALCAIADILDAAGIRHFLAAGTLLGFYRDGAPLAHDRDVDIGILAAPNGRPDLARVIREHPDLLLSRRARPGDRYFALVFQGIGIDLFLYEPGDGGLDCGLGRLAGDVAWRFSPFNLKPAAFQGRTWNIPDNPERYLAETYGAAWRTPDTEFASALSSPALYKVDPNVRAYYALARAHASRMMGEPAKARALLRQSPVPVELPGLTASLPPACIHPDRPFPATRNGEKAP